MGNIVVAVLYHQSILGRSIELTTTTYIHKYSDLLSSFSVVFLRFANRRCRMDGCTNPIQRTTKQTFSLTTTYYVVQSVLFCCCGIINQFIINQSIIIIFHFYAATTSIAVVCCLVVISTVIGKHYYYGDVVNPYLFLRTAEKERRYY